jgi:hypothetical protein
MTGVCFTASDCGAIDRVVLEIRQISTADVQASGVTITLDVPSDAASTVPTLRTQIGQLQLSAPAAAKGVMGTRYTDIDIACTDLLIKKPIFGCNQGALSARGAVLQAWPVGPIAIRAAASYDSSTGALSFNGSAPKLAGGTAQFNGRFASGVWSLDSNGDGLDLAALRTFAQPWFALPAGDSLGGHLQYRLESTGRLDARNSPGRLRAHLTLGTPNLNYSNQPGTTVGQNVAATLTATAVRDRGQWSADTELHGPSGQVLAGSVLLDFAKNPLSLQAHLEPNAAGVAVSPIRINQTDLIDARAEAQIAFAQQKGASYTIAHAHFDIDRLEFAAAYRSFLQLLLATTDFGALNVGGRATGSLDVANNAVSQLSAYLQNVSMADATARLSLANVNGEVHWAAAAGAAPQASQLAWSSSSAYGLIGGPVQMTFVAGGTDFTLGTHTRLPIFDGALVIHTLALRRLGSPDTELDFDAHLEPISMPLLSKAFGWPSLSGQVAGRIPGVTYRDHVLAAQGDLIANVFDGAIIGSHLRLSDPLGPWPRLDATVTARQLDLDLVTHTFSIGSITGRLDADIQGLELFNWSPVAFDARLQTTPGDRSKHLISQRAVTSISSVGGGGGGVAAALQSGFLKFFDTFHYDRLGVSCQLRDEVCLMSGIEPARDGYYLVKGRGLPRIDIIGNAGRVDWRQLVGQIAASVHSQNVVVR